MAIWLYLLNREKSNERTEREKVVNLVLGR